MDTNKLADLTALVARVAGLNPAVAEIGAGMLAQLVEQAKRVQSSGVLDTPLALREEAFRVGFMTARRLAGSSSLQGLDGAWSAYAQSAGKIGHHVQATTNGLFWVMYGAYLVAGPYDDQATAEDRARGLDTQAVG